MYVISEVDNNPLSYRFYSIHWAMIPNLAMDVIVPPIAKVIGLFQAGRLFMLLLIALLLSGVHAVHFGVTRRWSPSPLVAAIIMYNQALVYGLVNYLFGVGVVLWGLAVWISMRDKPPILRATISLIFVVATFFSHLAAAGLYALSVLAVEICANSGVRRDDRRPTSVDIAVFILPIAAIPLLMAFGPTIEHVDAVGWVGDACTSTPLRCYLSQKAKGVRWVFETYSSVIDLVVAAFMALGALWTWRRGWLRIHPVVGWLAGLAAPIYLAMPTEAFGSSLVDVRLPIGFALLVTGFLTGRLPTRRAHHVFLVALFGLVLLKVATVSDAWGRYARYSAEIESSFPRIEPGSKILVARSGDRKSVEPVESVPCLAIIDRSSLESLVFSASGQQILVVNPPYRDRATTTAP